MSKNNNEHVLLSKLEHYLPSQGPIKDFIHHNTLHAFQDMKFFDAIFLASEIFGYQTSIQLNEFRTLYNQKRIRTDVLNRILAEDKGEECVVEWRNKMLFGDYDVERHPRIGQLRSAWKAKGNVTLDDSVHPLLFRILCAYLDQGVSLTKFPKVDGGLLNSIRYLESTSFSSFFRTKRARQLVLDPSVDLLSLLDQLVGDESLYEQYLFDQQFSHPGWSGLVSVLEHSQHLLYDPREITLRDFIMLELILEIDVMEQRYNSAWQPLCLLCDKVEAPLFSPLVYTELHDVIRLWHLSFEWSYYDEVLSSLRSVRNRNHIHTKPDVVSTSFQAVFCIDERECSLRRHVETINTTSQTFGTPGFFGVEFYFQPEHAKFYDKLCPAPVTPKYLIKELNAGRDHKQESLYTRRTHTLLGGFVSAVTLGFWAILRLSENIFRPKMSPAISNAFTHLSKESILTVENQDPTCIENGLQVGFSVAEMTNRVEAQLRSIGLVSNFASLIYIVAHGSSSANNPHHSAHDCGACSGKPGSVNARVFATMANHATVREMLSLRGIIIPEEVVFLGALHDTAADQIEYYDVAMLDAAHAEMHKKNVLTFEEALNANAKERSRRFASINTKTASTKVRGDILKRAASLFEPRPELGHGTNALCIVGRRDLSSDLFLDRRAFLNSYDYRSDPDGSILSSVMRPIGLVCGGINLEYYFSRVDNLTLGAGTKLPHNVMGHLGIANSVDGDLRPGLPLQMIEVHDPVRLLVMVEHYPEIVLHSIQSSPEVFNWYQNEWVHIIAIHPEDGRYFYFKSGSFQEYCPLSTETPTERNYETLVENAIEMRTNKIVDSTQEHIAVHLIQ